MSSLPVMQFAVASYQSGIFRALGYFLTFSSINNGKLNNSQYRYTFILYAWHKISIFNITFNSYWSFLFQRLVYNVALYVLIGSQFDLRFAGFSSPAPMTLNSLYTDIRSSESLAIFRRRLKTYYFNYAFNL